MDGVHVSALRYKVVEVPCSSLDALMFDYLAFVMQQLKRKEEHHVSSRQSLCVFVLLSTFVNYLALSTFVYHLALVS